MIMSHHASRKGILPNFASRCLDSAEKPALRRKASFDVHIKGHSSFRWKELPGVHKSRTRTAGILISVNQALGLSYLSRGPTACQVQHISSNFPTVSWAHGVYAGLHRCLCRLPGQQRHHKGISQHLQLSDEMRQSLQLFQERPGMMTTKSYIAQTWNYKILAGQACG